MLTNRPSVAAMIKCFLAGLAMVMLACAQAQAQAQAAVPAEVRRMANWVAAAADNAGLPFVIIDKKEAQVIAFNSQGQILGAAPALLGLAVGDESAPGIGTKPLSAIPPRDRTTPAGRFVAWLGHEAGKDFLWVDYKDNIALHRVVAGTPKDRRLQRLATPTPRDNRISFGCINVPAAFFERTVLPAFRGTRGIVYILPEVRAMRDVFVHYHDLDQPPQLESALTR